MHSVKIFYGGFSFNYGGVINHANILKKKLNIKGYKVEIFCLDSLPYFVRFIPHILEKIINFFNFPLGFYYKGIVTGKLYKLFFLNQDKDDIYIFEDIYLSWNTSKKSIIFLHAVWSDNLQAYRFGKHQLNKLKLKEISKINNTNKNIFTVSTYYKNFLLNQHFKKKLKNKLKVIELGLDKININKKIKRNKKSIIYCGTLEKRKNLMFLLKIFNIIYSKDKAFKLNIIGDGPEKLKLNTYAENNRLPVNFIGKSFGKKKIYYLVSNTIYIHTSIKESFSYSLHEAKLYNLITFANKNLEIPKIFIDYKLNNYDKFKWANKVLLHYQKKPKKYKNLYSEEKVANKILKEIK